jgi:hypothetical protein
VVSHLNSINNTHHPYFHSVIGGKMSLKTINIQDDQGKDCPIRDIRAFQKHLQLFHRTGVSVHDEDGHYFTVDDAFRQKIDKLVEEADRSQG